MALSIPIISEFDGRGVDKAIKEFKQLETAGDKASFVLKKAFLPAVAVLGGMAAAAVPAVKAASDLNEVMSKSSVIFGDAAKEVQKFGDTTAKSFGISKTEALNAASTFGIFGKAAGLTGSNLAKFSTDFTALASDLASFNNTSPEQAITAIGAALRGESEPIRNYGVLLSDAVLKQEALALGIYDGVGALTSQQKVLAAQAAIYKQTTDAQGDFERTSGGLANQQRILSASIKDTQAAIGQALIPVVEAALPILNSFANWAKNNPKAFVAIAGAIAAVAASIVAVNIAMMANPFGLVAAGVAALVVGIVYLYNKFGWFRTGFAALMNILIGAVETFANSSIMALNAVIRAMNYINPFEDIPTISHVNLPRLNVSGGAAFPDLTAENRGAMTTATTIPTASVPSLNTGGTSSGGGGGGTTVTTAPTVSGGTTLPAFTPSFTAESFMAAHEGMFGTTQIEINVNGGLASSVEIGEAVVNSLRDYSNVNGPIDILVA